MSKTKYNTPSELIDSLIQNNPITTYKTSENEIKSIAANITKELNKQFGKEYDIAEKIESGEWRPPFALSWIIQPKVVNAKPRIKKY